ncbi:hypothetical protein WMF26_42625 [Sorangium sp. So ce185]|uniref:hypothetical protein n=1 Tax=Sorangium sp. So ce185 TaxID=3133287 RepID=UPI003F629CD4
MCGAPHDGRSSPGRGGRPLYRSASGARGAPPDEQQRIRGTLRGGRGPSIFGPTGHEPPFPDAATNPATAPVHTFHLGLWFNSPEDARAAGCPATVTPFNEDHTAGIQALSTRNFPDQHGPLRDVE